MSYRSRARFVNQCNLEEEHIARVVFPKYFYTCMNLYLYVEIK